MRLYSKDKLNSAVEKPYTKEEIRSLSLRHFITKDGIPHLALLVLFVAGLALVIGKSITLVAVVFLSFIALAFFLSMYSTVAEKYSEVVTYSELDEHRKELEDFLKEKGYFDSK